MQQHLIAQGNGKRASNPMSLRGRIKWALAGLVVGLCFLALSARGIDFAAVGVVLRDVRPTSVALAVLATFAFMAVKTWRWAVILRPGIRTNLGLLHSVTYIGSAANLVVVHSGELLRAIIVGRRGNHAPSAILASVGIERVFDMVAVLTLLAVLLVSGLTLSESHATAAVVAAGLVAISISGMLVVLKPSRIKREIGRLAGAVLPEPVRGWISEQVSRGLLGLAALNNVHTLLKTFALSILQWSCIVAAVWLSVQAVGYSSSLASAVGVWVLMVFGLTLPSSPAQLGTTQLAYTLGLSLTDVNDEVAFAASVVYVCTVNLPIMIIGAVCWLSMDRSGISIRNGERSEGAGGGR